MSDTKTAVVSGTDAAAFAEALAQHGFDITATPATLSEVIEVAGGLEVGSVDLYVQLPVRIPAEGGNAVAVVRHFLSEGLLRRFDAAEAMLPALSGAGVVALVSGNHPGTTAAPDNPEARIALMKVLGHTLLLERNGAVAADETGSGLQVKVISGTSDVAELAATIAEPQQRPLRVFANMAESEPTLDYAGWRDAILTLTETSA